MESIRTLSIQDIAKNINSKISGIDIIALFLVLLVLVGLYAHITLLKKRMEKPITYKENKSTYQDTEKKTVVLGSTSGTTYTYAWCSDALRIKEENKIFFVNEEEAQRAGRRLSKRCTK